MLKTAGLAITILTIVPVSIFFTLGTENKRERLTAATLEVTVFEVSQCRGKGNGRYQAPCAGCEVVCVKVGL
jgi:hypothetical protein